MKRNKWIVHWDYTVNWESKWTAIQEEDLPKLIEFCHGVVALSEKTKIRQIHRSPKPYEFILSDKLNYAQYAEKILSDENVLPFLGFGTYVYKKDFDVRSKVAYYNANGEIIENDITNLGELLGELVTDEFGTYPSRHLAAVTPVAMSGTRYINVNDIKETGGIDVSLSILLHSDIWFPKAYDYLADMDEDIFYDNSELALRHTPRLNEFIRGVKQLTLDLQGSWELFEYDGVGMDPKYMDMVNENGIILET